MSFHEDAIALARQAIAIKRSEEEARNESERKAREESIEEGKAACKSMIMDWMIGIGMAPPPEITLNDLGLHDYYSDDGGAPMGKERRIGASWVFDGHYYKAEYKTQDGKLDAIAIRIADERGGTLWSPVRSPHGDRSVEKDKIEIGKALLKESAIQAQRVRGF